MELDDLYTALSTDLIEELGGIAQVIGQITLNATRGEMAVLHALYTSDGPLTPGAIASSAVLSTARVANILRSLEEKGWVERRHSTRDRRSVEVSLTDSGRVEAEARRGESLRSIAVVLRDLGEDDARELVRLVASVRSSVERRTEDNGTSGREEPPTRR